MIGVAGGKLAVISLCSELIHILRHDLRTAAVDRPSSADLISVLSRRGTLIAVSGVGDLKLPTNGRDERLSEGGTTNCTERFAASIAMNGGTGRGIALVLDVPVVG